MKSAIFEVKKVKECGTISKIGNIGFVELIALIFVIFTIFHLFHLFHLFSRKPNQSLSASVHFRAAKRGEKCEKISNLVQQIL